MITAEEARKITDKALNDQRELDEISKKIKAAAQQGESMIEVNRLLSAKMIDILLENGYKLYVIEDSTMITWKPVLHWFPDGTPIF